jgi:hypothetical protein
VVSNTFGYPGDFRKKATWHQECSQHDFEYLRCLGGFLVKKCLDIKNVCNIFSNTFDVQMIFWKKNVFTSEMFATHTNLMHFCHQHESCSQFKLQFCIYCWYKTVIFFIMFFKLSRYYSRIFPQAHAGTLQIHSWKKN